MRAARPLGAQRDRARARGGVCGAAAVTAGAAFREAKPGGAADAVRLAGCGAGDADESGQLRARAAPLGQERQDAGADGRGGEGTARHDRCVEAGRASRSRAGGAHGLQLCARLRGDRHGGGGRVRPGQADLDPPKRRAARCTTCLAITTSTNSCMRTSNRRSFWSRGRGGSSGRWSAGPGSCQRTQCARRTSTE